MFRLMSCAGLVPEPSLRQKRSWSGGPFKSQWGVGVARGLLQGGRAGPAPGPGSTNCLSAHLAAIQGGLAADGVRREWDQSLRIDPGCAREWVSGPPAVWLVSTSPWLLRECRCPRRS